jgi:hypothetical protein
VLEENRSGLSSPRRKSKRDRELQNQEKPLPMTRTARKKLPAQDCRVGAEMKEGALEK